MNEKELRAMQAGLALLKKRKQKQTQVYASEQQEQQQQQQQQHESRIRQHPSGHHRVRKMNEIQTRSFSSSSSNNQNQTSNCNTFTTRTVNPIDEKLVASEQLAIQDCDDLRNEHHKEKSTENKAPPKYKSVIAWKCTECERECIPVREQSRCLCGHRLRDHPSEQSFSCSSRGCSCSKFYYIVAEGAWILRCRCKHKHTDHNPAGKKHECKRANCSCSSFNSPWVCNCDHPWGQHKQVVERRRVKTLEEMCRDGSLDFGIGGDDVQRTDLYANPLMR